MSKQRYVDTKFWSDTWASNLDPVEKLLFLYLLTNERTNIAGVYELPVKLMANETGIEKEMIEKILSRFERERKVIMSNGWIIIINFRKHQAVNPNIEKGIAEVINSLPENIRIAYDSLLKPIDSLLKPSNNINTNTNTNTNNNTTYVENPFVFSDYIKDKLLLSEKPSMKIIGLYWRHKKYSFGTYKQMESALKRELRAAKVIESYPEKSIIATMEYLEQKDFKWTLETIAKYINEDLTNLMEKDKKFKGEWKCDFGYWHNKNEQCGHSMIDERAKKLISK